MKPLQAVALGLVLLALGPADPAPGRFDPLPDPLGWLLILVGLHGLRGVIDPRRLGTLRVLGVLALVASIVLVVPDAARWLQREEEPALGWVVDVPRLVFFALLCAQLSRRALEARQQLAASVFSISGAALLFAVAAPPLAFGGGLSGVGAAGEVALQVSQLVLIVACLAYGSRSWAGAPAPDAEPA